jgi:uncharacterized membrane protein
MWSIAELKSRGKQAFRANYWQSVAVSFVMAIFAGGTASAASNRVQSTTSEVTVEGAGVSPEQAAFLAAVVLGVIFTVGIVGSIVHALLANPIEVGGRRFFEKNANDPTTQFNTVFEGFQDYGRVLVTMLIRDVFILLWTLLLIIPGAMKAYSYRLVPYLVKDRPELSPMEVLAESEALMRGNRWQAFVMDLSFLGWLLLGVVTLNLGNIFWTNPYMNATDAALYQQLIERA